MGSVAFPEPPSTLALPSQRPNTAAETGEAMPREGVDPSDTRLAVSVLTRSLRLRRGENVIIETWPHNVALAEEFVVQARRLGLRPMVVYEGERAFFDSQRLASLADGSAIAAPELAAIAAADGYVCLPGPADYTRWSDLPPPRKASLERWLGTWNRILRDRSVRACYLHAAIPTELTARQHGVDLAAWRRESRDASDIDPGVFRHSARRLVRRLGTGRRVRITHPNGTRLDLQLAGRTPFLEDGCVDADDLRSGRYWTGVPAGYLITALDERRAEGRFVASRASRHRRGVNPGIEWTFHNGRLISYESQDRSGAFVASYREAGRERDRPALLSIGLNPRIHDAPLLEDQGRGVVALYIGRNEDHGGRTGGSFRDYALLEGADVTVDGRTLVSAGTPV